jgi:uncharacterized protein DUF6544
MSATQVPRAARSRRTDWIGLATGTGTDQFTAENTASLPEPARRWLTHAIAPRTPLWSSAELTMHGEIRLGTWRPFHARQILTPPDGFIWAASARVAGLPVMGFDRYSNDSGEMRWRLFGLVPVLTAHGPDVTRSAGGRLAAEGLTLLPTCFPKATWARDDDPDTAVGTTMIGGEQESVRLRVGPQGELREVLLHRWGNPDRHPYGRYPFGVTVHTERTVSGITIPASLTAGWWHGTDRQAGGEFFRAIITAATFR